MNPKISKEQCFAHVEEYIFQKQPQGYCEDYPQWPGLVGLEWESTPFLWDQPHPKRPPLFGSTSIVSQLEKIFQNPTRQSINGEEKITGFSLKDADITFEPGGQIEIATHPKPCLFDAATTLKRTHAQMEKEFLSQGWEFLSLGADPWNTVEDIKLQIPKTRYSLMNDYYKKIGPFGQRMMRQTMTVQVNLDFGTSDETLALRYYAAQMLAPYSTAIFCCSPRIDGSKTEHLSHRSHIWRKTDPTHTGLVLPRKLEVKNLNSKQTSKEYTEFSLKAKPIYRLVNGKPSPFETPFESFSQWLESNSPPTLEEYKEHLSLLFPEVRPKGFLEFRSFDAVPKHWIGIPPLFLCSLLYNDKNLEKIMDLLSGDLNLIEEDLWEASFGLRSERIAKRSHAIMSLALEGIDQLPDCFYDQGEKKRFTQFADHFTFQRKTPGDELKDIHSKDELSKLLALWQEEI